MVRSVTYGIALENSPPPPLPRQHVMAKGRLRVRREMSSHDWTAVAPISIERQSVFALTLLDHRRDIGQSDCYGTAWHSCTVFDNCVRSVWRLKTARLVSVEAVAQRLRAHLDSLLRGRGGSVCDFDGGAG